MKGLFPRILTVILSVALLAILGACGSDPQPKPLYTPPAGGNTGGNTTGDNNNNGGDECTAGVCTAIQGGSVCLENDQPPANSPTCDGQTGAGCPDHLDPVGDGAGGCVCVEYCENPVGGGGNTGGGTGTGGECTTGGTCTEIQGGSVCLDNGGIPAGAESCDATTGEGCPTNKVPVNAQDQSGATSCVCVEDCATTGGGDTPPPTGDCPVGTCTAIQGGNICLENGGIPAGSESCDATTGEGCPTDKMPVNAQDQSGATSCVCVYSC